MEAHGTVSVISLTRAMARTDDGRSTLVEVKAVDNAYPLFGSVVTDPQLPLDKLFAPNNSTFGGGGSPCAADAARSESRRPHYDRQRHNRVARR